MELPAERWSRGCGNGNIGLSGHVTEYSAGVRNGNWVENMAKVEALPTDTILSHAGAPHAPPNSTQRLSYTPEGKTGEALLEASQRYDQDQMGLKADLLTRHGAFDQPPVQCLASTYQLTHGRADGTDRRPQAYIWAGRKQVDYHVPYSTTTLNASTRKQQEWGAQHEGHNPYETTQQAALFPAAVAAAEDSPYLSTGTLKPVSDSGEVTHPGNRPKGPNKDDLDKDYHRIGLRTTYRN